MIKYNFNKTKYKSLQNDDYVKLNVRTKMGKIGQWVQKFGDVVRCLMNYNLNNTHFSWSVMIELIS